MANAATEVMVGELLEALSAVLADPSAQDNPNVMRTVTEVLEHLGGMDAHELAALFQGTGTNSTTPQLPQPPQPPQTPPPLEQHVKEAVQDARQQQLAATVATRESKPQATDGSDSSLDTDWRVLLRLLLDGITVPTDVPSMDTLWSWLRVSCNVEPMSLSTRCTLAFLRVQDVARLTTVEDILRKLQQPPQDDRLAPAQQQQRAAQAALLLGRQQGNGGLLASMLDPRPLEDLMRAALDEIKAFSAEVSKEDAYRVLRVSPTQVEGVAVEMVQQLAVVAQLIGSEQVEEHAEVLRHVLPVENLAVVVAASRLRDSLQEQLRDDGEATAALRDATAHIVTPPLLQLWVDNNKGALEKMQHTVAHEAEVLRNELVKPRAVLQWMTNLLPSAAARWDLPPHSLVMLAGFARVGPPAMKTFLRTCIHTVLRHCPSLANMPWITMPLHLDVVVATQLAGLLWKMGAPAAQATEDLPMEEVELFDQAHVFVPSMDTEERLVFGDTIAAYMEVVGQLPFGMLKRLWIHTSNPSEVQHEYLSRVGAMVAQWLAAADLDAPVWMILHMSRDVAAGDARAAAIASAREWSTPSEHNQPLVFHSTSLPLPQQGAADADATEDVAVASFLKELKTWKNTFDTDLVGMPPAQSDWVLHMMRLWSLPVSDMLDVYNDPAAAVTFPSLARAFAVSPMLQRVVDVLRPPPKMVREDDVRRSIAQTVNHDVFQGMWHEVAIECTLRHMVVCARSAMGLTSYDEDDALLGRGTSLLHAQEDSHWWNTMRTWEWTWQLVQEEDNAMSLLSSVAAETQQYVNAVVNKVAYDGEEHKGTDDGGDATDTEDLLTWHHAVDTAMTHIFALAQEQRYDTWKQEGDEEALPEDMEWQVGATTMACVLAMPRLLAERASDLFTALLSPRQQGGDAFVQSRPCVEAMWAQQLRMEWDGTLSTQWKRSLRDICKAMVVADQDPSAENTEGQNSNTLEVGGRRQLKRVLCMTSREVAVVFPLRALRARETPLDAMHAALLLLLTDSEHFPAATRALDLGAIARMANISASKVHRFGSRNGAMSARRLLDLAPLTSVFTTLLGGAFDMSCAVSGTLGARYHRSYITTTEEKGVAPFFVDDEVSLGTAVTNFLSGMTQGTVDAKRWAMGTKGAEHAAELILSTLAPSQLPSNAAFLGLQTRLQEEAVMQVAMCAGADWKGPNVHLVPALQAAGAVKHANEALRGLWRAFECVRVKRLIAERRIANASDAKMWRLQTFARFAKAVLERRTLLASSSDNPARYSTILHGDDDLARTCELNLSIAAQLYVNELKARIAKHAGGKGRPSRLVLTLPTDCALLSACT